MQRDDIKKALESATDEEKITNLLNLFHGAEKTKSEEITALKNKVSQMDEINTKYEELQSQMNEINKANMSEQDKLEEMKKETAKNLKLSQEVYNTAKAKEILAGEEVDKKIIKKLTGGTLEETIELATLYKQQMNNLRDSVAKQTKEQLTNIDLKPSMSNVNQGEEDVMNFEKFAKLSAEEQEKFITEHPEEFNNL